MLAPLVPMTRMLKHDKAVLPESTTPLLLSLLSIYPFFLSTRRIDKEALAALEQCLEPVSLPVMTHLSSAIEPGGLAIHSPNAPPSHDGDSGDTSAEKPRAKWQPFVSAASPRTVDRRRRYLQVMHRVRTPVLAIAGNKDLQCGEDAVLRTLEALGSARKRFVQVGSSSDATVEASPLSSSSSYGHMDLLLGAKAHVDVFPLVAAWLEEADREGSRWARAGTDAGEEKEAEEDRGGRLSEAEMEEEDDDEEEKEGGQQAPPAQAPWQDSGGEERRHSRQPPSLEVEF